MLIDNIYINQISSVIISGNIILDISDHFSQFCTIKSLNARELPKNLCIGNYSEALMKILTLSYSRSTEMTMTNCRDNADAPFLNSITALTK